MTPWDALPLVLAAIALLAIAGVRASWKQTKASRNLSRWGWFGLATSASGLAILAAVATVATFWYAHRRQPEPTAVRLFEGVTYRRLVRRTPRPLVIHAVRVDLKLGIYADP